LGIFLRKIVSKFSMAVMRSVQI